MLKLRHKILAAALLFTSPIFAVAQTAPKTPAPAAATTARSTSTPPPPTSSRPSPASATPTPSASSTAAPTPPRTSSSPAASSPRSHLRRDQGPDHRQARAVQVIKTISATPIRLTATMQPAFVFAILYAATIGSPPISPSRNRGVLRAHAPLSGCFKQNFYAQANGRSLARVPFFGGTSGSLS